MNSEMESGFVVLDTMPALTEPHTPPTTPKTPELNRYG